MPRARLPMQDTFQSDSFWGEYSEQSLESIRTFISAPTTIEALLKFLEEKEMGVQKDVNRLAELSLFDEGAKPRALVRKGNLETIQKLRTEFTKLISVKG